jgi:GntR family transcriptional regulator/MocR family aminotransferase
LPEIDRPAACSAAAPPELARQLLRLNARLLLYAVFTPDLENVIAQSGVARKGQPAPAYPIRTTPDGMAIGGGVMPLARRLEWLQFAARHDTLLLEDDYDSEYRYGGRPLAAMQGIDASGRVIYVGTFSKTMFPALRVGYLVVPASLVEPFRVAMRHTGHSASVVVQGALADFIMDGHFATHVRRMRVLYATRQARLLRGARRHLAGVLEIGEAEAGMHLLGTLPAGSDDVALAARAAEAGVIVRPLSVHYLERAARTGLLLGYAGVPEREIDRGVERLAEVLRHDRRRGGSGMRSRA